MATTIAIAMNSDSDGHDDSNGDDKGEDTGDAIVMATMTMIVMATTMTIAEQGQG